jgi:molybdate transport system substrate-binding protein
VELYLKNFVLSRIFDIIINYLNIVFIKEIVMKKFIILIFMTLILFAKTELIFYCGITMVKPMSEIAKIIEKKYNVKIKILQGGSGDLYDSLSLSKKGDLYLPGSDTYIKKHLSEGLLGYKKYIGYNQIAIFVKKNNPHKVKNLDDLTRNDLSVSLGNPETCSMGKATNKVLKKYKGEDFLYEVEDNMALYSSDSRDFNQLLKHNQVDVGLNWKATAFFPENRKYIDIVEINEKYAPKKRLVLTLLNFSKNKKIAKAFIDFSASMAGQKIMREYGFLDE